MGSKAVFVTGASSGIGLACCRLLASRGWRVALADINVKDGQTAAAQIREQHSGSDARFYPLDVCNEVQTENTVEQIIADYGGLDGAIANAGVVYQKPFLETSTEEFQSVVHTNLLVRPISIVAVQESVALVCIDCSFGCACNAECLFVLLQGTFLTGRTVARAMKDQGTGGSIVNMSSVNASLVIPGMAGYVSSKGGVQQLTRLMAIELAPHAIRVNAIAPGSVGTEMAFATYRDPTPVAGLGGLTKETLMFARTPIGRMAEPLEIASIASFLLSDDSSYVTGESIQCDGARAHLNGTVPIPHGTVPAPERHV